MTASEMRAPEDKPANTGHGFEPGLTVGHADAHSTRLTIARTRAAIGGTVNHRWIDIVGCPEYIVTQGAWATSFSTRCELEAWLDRQGAGGAAR